MKLVFIATVMLCKTFFSFVNVENNGKDVSVYEDYLAGDTVYKEGVYLTFDEFKNNAPSIPYVLAGVNKQDSMRFKVAKKTGDSTYTPVDSLWGLCIQGEVYLYDDGKLIPIEKQDTAYYASSVVPTEERKNQATFWRRSVDNIEAKKDNPYADYNMPSDSSAADTTIITTPADTTVTNNPANTSVSNSFQPVLSNGSINIIPGYKPTQQKVLQRSKRYGKLNMQTGKLIFK